MPSTDPSVSQMTLILPERVQRRGDWQVAGCIRCMPVHHDGDRGTGFDQLALCIPIQAAQAGPDVSKSNESHREVDFGRRGPRVTSSPDGCTYPQRDVLGGSSGNERHDEAH